MRNSLHLCTDKKKHYDRKVNEQNFKVGEYVFTLLRITYGIKGYQSHQGETRIKPAFHFSPCYRRTNQGSWEQQTM